MAKRAKIKQPVRRSLMWRLLQEPGSEIVDVRGAPGEGWRFRGHIHLAADGALVRVAYLILCDEDWTTRYVDIELYPGSEEPRFVQLLNDPDSGWLRRDARDRDAAPERDFHPVPDLTGAIDIDLEWSPLTNALPLGRLAPRVGHVSEPLTAWVRFPALSVEPSLQRYTRLAVDRYRFESIEGDYAAEIETDDLGFVLRYGDVWERAASAATSLTPQPPLPSSGEGETPNVVR